MGIYKVTARLNPVADILVIAVILGGFLMLLSSCQIWSAQTANIPSGLPNIDRLYMFSTGPDGQTNKLVTALNPNNGYSIWDQTADSKLSGYGISIQDNLYLPAQDGNVYAFRGRDGQPLWHTSISHGTPGLTGVWLQAYHNLIIDSISKASHYGDLYALNAQTGNVVWHTSISCSASSTNNCAASGRITLVANGIIYGLADDGLSAWKAANGQFLWRNSHYQLNGQPQSMVVTHGKVYVTNFYPEVDVLDAISGHYLHSLRPPEPNDSGAVVYDIAASENTVYILGGQTVSAYRASDDSLLWKQPFIYHSGGTIYVSSSGIYVNYYDISMGKGGSGSGSGNDLYALRPVDGQQIWHRQVPIGGNNLYPIEFNGVICFGGAGNVYSFRVSDGKLLWQFSKVGYVDGLFGS